MSIINEILGALNSNGQERISGEALATPYNELLSETDRDFIVEHLETASAALREIIDGVNGGEATPEDSYDQYRTFHAEFGLAFNAIPTLAMLRLENDTTRDQIADRRESRTTARAEVAVNGSEGVQPGFESGEAGAAASAAASSDYSI